MPPLNQVAPRVTLRDYAASILGLAIATAGLAWQIFGWPPEWSGTFPKVVAVSATFIASAVVQVVALRHDLVARGRDERRDAIRDVLDKVLDHEGIDPDEGRLDARMNVMKVHGPLVNPFNRRLPAKWYWPPQRKLYIFASSSNMEGLPEGGLAWQRGNGCAGELWATGDHIAAACLSGESTLSNFVLSEVQQRLTRDCRCIISFAVFEGIGPAQRLRGILNLDSSSVDAIEAWTDSGKPLEEVRAVLRGVALFLVENRLLD